jgi:glycosyltransferase involved in cell wall biosynthesis
MSFVYAWYAARMARRVGLIYTEHSEADVFRAAGIWRPAGTGLIRGCDAVVGVSERVSAALRSHFRVNPNRIRTIQNGVDFGRFETVSGERTAARRELGIDDGAFVIGHVANFRRNKNHIFLLKAFLKAFERRENVKLVLLGQGFPADSENSEPAIRAFVQDNGLESTVHLLGYRPDVPRVMSALDLFCLVSHKEGLPLSVLEAMASGLPVVVTDIDGLKEVVEAEVNGLRVAPDDVEGLTGALRRLCADSALRRRLGDAGRKSARERYSFARCLTQTESLLASVVRNGSTHQV